MLSVLFHQLIPASLYGGQTAFPVLSKIDRELRRCSHAAAAASVLEKSKWDLYARLHGRFSSTVAKARLSHPSDVAVDAASNVYIADSNNNRIRRVTSGGVIDTVAGDGSYAFRGDGGPAAEAYVANPKGLAFGPDGSLYIADTDNHRIRRISPGGTIVTVAGSGEVGGHGDGGPATSAGLIIPEDIAVDAGGRLYIADPATHRLRQVNLAGVIETVAGTGASGLARQGVAATESPISSPNCVAVASAGDIYVCEPDSGRLLRIGPDGILHFLSFRFPNDDVAVIGLSERPSTGCRTPRDIAAIAPAARPGPGSEPPGWAAGTQPRGDRRRSLLAFRRGEFALSDPIFWRHYDVSSGGPARCPLHRVVISLRRCTDPTPPG